jgi:hypothetical protein
VPIPANSLVRPVCERVRLQPACDSAVHILDRLLLANYAAAESFAWPGAAPAVDEPQLDFWWDGVDAGVEVEAGERSPFRRAGFTVQPVRGKGAAKTIDRFCRNHHRYLRGRGMAGEGFGMFTPDGELVGVANFAPCSNPRTATGMQYLCVPEDEKLSPRELAHVRVGEREYVDCVRLCVAETTRGGVVLGTGAESFLYASCLRRFSERNRQLWRAIRMSELGLPLPLWAVCLISNGTTFTKLVRTFADPAENHTGGIYAAAGAWYLGLTRPSQVLVGRRTGESITRRALSKLRGRGHGHVHQVLRAAFEGSHATAESRGDGQVRLVIDLRKAVEDLPSILDGAELRKRLAARWREISREAPADSWHLVADTEGYDIESRPPKHLYGTYMGAPFWAAQMLRRCRRVRAEILTAEAAWYSSARRRPRSVGYGWNRPPAALGRPHPPRRPE